MQGEPSRGVYLIESGSVRLSLEPGPEAEKPIYERVMGSGSLLGLPATINNLPYSATAMAIEDTELSFVAREDLLALMMKSSAMAITILQLLSQEIHDMRNVIVNAKPGAPRPAPTRR